MIGALLRIIDLNQMVRRRRFKMRVCLEFEPETSFEFVRLQVIEIRCCCIKAGEKATVLFKPA